MSVNLLYGTQEQEKESIRSTSRTPTYPQAHAPNSLKKKETRKKKTSRWPWSGRSGCA